MQALSIAIACMVVSSAAVAQIKISVECLTAGTQLDGSRSSQPIPEQILVEKSEQVTPGKDGKPEKWGISKAELTSGGVKQDPHLVAVAPEYAVLAYANPVGAGLNRRLLAFTYVLDLKAMQLTRIVNAVPAGAEERNQGQCRAK
jgi:hypothetical protein